MKEGNPIINVILNSKKEVYNLTEEEEKKIKADLTLPNPAYISALRYSPYAKVNLPKTISYYEYRDGSLCVPRGYEIPFENQVIEDVRFENKVYFPKVKITPRDMQIGALESFGNRTDAMLISPTGSGKSIVALLLLAKLNQKALVLVHKDDLFNGWINDAKMCFGLRAGQIGAIKGQVYRVGKWITISTIQTLSKLSEEKLEELRREFGAIVCDELHHSPSKSWEVVNTFPAKYRIGVTATPIRNDGLGEVMFFYFGKPFYEYRESEANKDIIPPSKVFIKKKIVGTVFNPEEKYVDTKSGREITKILDSGVYRNIDELTNFEIEFYISKKLIKRKPMDYMQARKTIQNDQFFMKQLCKDIEKEVAEEKSCVVFCFEKEHCRAIFDFLREMGISQSVMQLYYGDSKESKELMKEKAERKEVLVTIATYAIATEGTNLRSWERLFFTIGPGNAKDTIQAIGRGRRTFAGKSDLVVYDYVFPNVMGIRNHFRKREKVYKDIGFKII